MSKHQQPQFMDGLKLSLQDAPPADLTAEVPETLSKLLTEKANKVIFGQRGSIAPASSPENRNAAVVYVG